MVAALIAAWVVVGLMTGGTALRICVSPADRAGSAYRFAILYASVFVWPLLWVAGARELLSAYRLAVMISNWGA